MTQDVFGIVGTTQRGSFRIERVVAEGGFSVVYKAQHGAFRAPVALKCLKMPGTTSPSENEAFLEKLREEAELLFRLSASIPEVVRPLHVDALDLKNRFVPFLALEWLEGEALDEFLRRRRDEGQAPMSLHKLVRLLAPVARGLSRAHRFPGPAGIVSVVHRDIKPENILIANVNGEETVKILDFGIAKAQALAELRAGRGVEADALSAFTPAYGAPEQWSPRQFGPTGPWTDVWGLAVTMVEALAGRPAIVGEVREMMATALSLERRPTPRGMGVVVPEEVERAFVRALEVDPAKRTHDVETFWGELEVAVGQAPSLSRRDRRRDVTDGESSRTAWPPPSRSDGGDGLKASGGGASAAPGDVPSLPPLDAPSGRSFTPSPSARIFEGGPSRDSGGSVSSSSHQAAAGAGDEASAASRSSPQSPRAPGSGSASPSRASSSGAHELFETGKALSLDDIDIDASIEIDLASLRDGGRDSSRDSARRGPSSTRQGPGGAAGTAPPLTPHRLTPHRGSSPSRPRASAPTPVAPARPERNLGEALRLPIQIVVLGCAIGLIDVLLSRALDVPLQVGPVRPVWLSVALVIAGILFSFWRLLTDDG